MHEDDYLSDIYDQVEYTQQRVEKLMLMRDALQQKLAHLDTEIADATARAAHAQERMSQLRDKDGSGAEVHLAQRSLDNDVHPLNADSTGSDREYARGWHSGPHMDKID